MSLFEIIFIAVWLFLPAGIANAAASQGKHFKFLDFLAIPVDGGLTIGGQRLLGKNKTVRGFILGTLASAILGCFMMQAYGWLDIAETFDFSWEYGDLRGGLFGACIGFGALLGDSVESFFKRRIGVKPGEPWFPFDQLDYIIGSTVMSLILVQLELEIYIAYFLIFFPLHLIVKYVGFHLGLDDKKF